MNLTVDIGNTLCKFALFHNDEIVKLYKSSKPLFNDLQKIIQESEHATREELKKLIISSVRKSKMTFELELQEKYQCIELNNTTELPFFNNYQSKDTLGKDRIALVAGAISLFPDENLLIIDAGTAITFDFVDKDKNYWGGSIAPGLNMRLDALHNYASNLPRVEKIKDKPHLIGNTTDLSIRSGVYNGMLAEIEGLIKKYLKYHSVNTVLMTGGDAFYFAEQLKSNIFAEPNLVHIGLNYILNYNAEK